MPNIRNQKILKKIVEDLEYYADFILVSYSYLNVKSATDFRLSLKKGNAKFKIIKNNLFRQALTISKIHKNRDVIKKTFVDMKSEKFGEIIFGPMAVIFSKTENLPLAAKVCKIFPKDDFEKISVKAGFFDGNVLEKQDVKSIADLPSREELLAKVAYGINSPARNISSGINQILSQLARSIQICTEKRNK